MADEDEIDPKDEAENPENLTARQLLDRYADVLNSPGITTDKIDDILKELENVDVGFAYDDIAKLGELKNLAEKKKEELIPSLSSDSKKSPNDTSRNYSDEIITVHADGKNILDTFATNQERREFVGKEFRKGEFTSQAHADFYLEQLAKGNIVLPDKPEDIEKIDALIGGKSGIQNLQDEIAKNIVEKLAVTYRTSTGIGNNTGSFQSPATMTISDFGLGNALKRYQKAERRDDLEFILREAKKSEIAYKYSGDETFKKSIKSLKEKREGISKWRFRSRQRLEKAIKDIDPASYWKEKRETSHWFGLKAYYAPRAFFAKRKSTKFDRLQKKLEKTIDLKNKDASMKWLSKNAFNKAWIKTRLLFRKTPEKMTNKLLENANISQLNSFVDKLDAQIKLKANENFSDRQNVFAQQSTLTMLGKIKENCQSKVQNLEAQKQQAISALGNDTINNSGATLQSVTKNLEEKVAFLNREYAKQLQQNPAFQIYIKLHGYDALPKNGKVNREIINTEAVLHQMSKDLGYPNIEALLKDHGLKPKEIEAVKERLIPQKEEPTDTATNAAVNEQSEYSKEQQPFNNQTRPCVSNKENTPGYRADFDLEGYSKDENRNVYINDENKDTVFLNIADDKSRYDLITKDKEDQDREPTPAEIEAMVKRMANDGIKEVTLEQGFSKETDALFVAAFNKYGMDITNNEEVQKRINGSRQDNMEPKRTENKSERQSKSGKSKPKQAPKEKLAKGNIDAKKILIGAINSSKTIDDQNKKIEMIIKIQKGEKLTSSEIQDTFGKGSDEANFFCNFAAYKEIEKESVNDTKMEKWVKEEKTKAGLKDKTISNVSVKVSDITKLADSYTDKYIDSSKDPEDILKNDETYQSLPKYAKQGVKNLLIINNLDKENSELNPEQKAKLSEQKAKLRGQVLGQIIQGKNRPLPKQYRQYENTRQTNQTNRKSEGR